MRIALGADHRGVELKEAVATFLTARGIDTIDLGAHERASVDYPEYAERVAQDVSRGNAEYGILICGSGLGMSMAANKVPRIRAAVCGTPELAKMARSHNDANVLVLAADGITVEEAQAIIDAWLTNPFEGAVRHKRRIRQIRLSESRLVEPVDMYEKDAEVYAALEGEAKRQSDSIVLIASESIASRAVREAQASVLTNKYAEGYPAQRWYEGCRYADEVEELAIERAKQLFGAEHANVQPHCGSSANMGVYFSIMNPGDTMLTMKLSDGGHLTHGHPINFSGRLFNVVSYGVSKKSEQIDYDEMAELAEKHRPKLIVVGCSSYSRIIDFKRVRKIADATGAYVMADIAHIAGLVVAGCHPSPVPHCDFVTGTTHKTLCGPRGGFILCRKRFAADIDRQIFPGIQGGPLMHVVAAKAVCFYEAVRPAFKKYMQQIVRNSQALANALAEDGLRIVSGGTDNHLALIDLSSLSISGRDAASALQKARIVLNKNAIPFDKRGPGDPSGIRVGTPTVTARGMSEQEMKVIGGCICEILDHPDNESVRKGVRAQVADLVEQFPIP